MFIDRLSEKFSEFYSEKDIVKAKLISKNILDMLEEKGLKPYEPTNDREGIYIASFNRYFENFESNPNPYKDEIEIIRIIAMNTLRYDP